jgi:predicted nucleic acid-binding protein
MITVDTNIAFYALAREGRAVRAKEILREAHFLSVQVINEYAFSARRKLRREWHDIAYDLEILRYSVPEIHSIDTQATLSALRLAERYQLAFFDALMIAVALAGGATTLYSEDMHHGLYIDDALTIINPFLSAEQA